MTNIVDLTKRLRRKSNDKLLRKAIEKVKSMPPEMEEYLEASWQLIIADLALSVEGEIDPDPMSEEIMKIVMKGHDCYFGELVDGNETPFVRDETEVCLICARKVQNIMAAVAGKGGKGNDAHRGKAPLH